MILWKFIKKIKIEFPYESAIPLLGIQMEKNVIPKGYMHPNVHCSTVYNIQDREATYMFIDRGMSKEYVHSGIQCVNNGMLLHHLKERNNAICSNMDGPGWSKSDREWKILYDILTFGI